jgi:hypothetical protein
MPLHLTHIRVNRDIVYMFLRTIVVEFPFKNGAVSDLLEEVDLTVMDVTERTQRLEQY